MARTTRKKRLFNGLPLRDAEKPVLLPLLDLDIERATETLKDAGVNDPERFKSCVVAEACQRVFGDEQNVRILRTVAYRALPRKGFALRYEITDNVREIVEAFDKGEPIPELPEGVIELRPPTKERSLVQMRTYWRRYKAKHPDANKARKTERKQRASDPLSGQVRNGHFVKL